MEAPRLTTVLYLTVCYVLLHFHNMSVTGVGALNTFNGPSASKLPLSPKELRRLKAKGVEVMPGGPAGLATNTISQEPSCDELRAMWRYYKRQSRAAELTNEISSNRFPDLFWNLPPAGEPSSFGPFRGRGRTRLRPKGPPRDALYGRILLQPPNKAPRRRPVEEVVRMFGPGSRAKADTPRIQEPVVHLTPPPEPTESSFQKLKEIYREERVKVGQHPSAISSNDKDFGTLVLSPPNGQDGRIANKPKELMTSFEKIRFGHADDLLGVNDDIGRRSGLFPVKRRNGFIGLPILNPHRIAGVKSFFGPGSNQEEPRRHHEPISVATSEGFFDIGYPDSDAERNDDSLIPLLAEYQVDNPAADLLMDKQPFMVEEPTVSCPEMENQSCTTNADCSCVGFGLFRCNLGQCQIMSLLSAVGDTGNGNSGTSGLWHSEPLPLSQLGIWEDRTGEMKKKRAIQPINPAPKSA